VIKTKGRRRGHVALIGERRVGHRVWWVNLKGNRQLGRPRCR